MPKVLVVEDDENKRSQIDSFLKDRFPLLDVMFARSLRSGLVALEVEKPSLIILDMTLPNFDQGLDDDGGVIHPLGGQEFLRKMKRRRISAPVIVLTQFESFGKGVERMDLGSLRERLETKYPDLCVETIYYNNTVEAWQLRLHAVMREILGEK